MATANLPASLTVNSLFPQTPRRTFFMEFSAWPKQLPKTPIGLSETSDVFSRLGTSGLQPSNRRALRFFHSEEASVACKQGGTRWTPTFRVLPTKFRLSSQASSSLWRTFKPWRAQRSTAWVKASTVTGPQRVRPASAACPTCRRTIGVFCVSATRPRRALAAVKWAPLPKGHRSSVGMTFPLLWMARASSVAAR